MDSYKLLRLAEYAAAAASVAGAIATISTQQVTYTAIPLAVSISLNLVSRHQHEKRLERRFSQTKTDVDQQLQQVQQRLKTIDLSIADAATSAQANSQSLFEQATEQIQALSGNISSLQERLAQQGATSQTSIEHVAEELQRLQASVTETLSSVQNRQAQSEQALQQIQPLSSELGSLQERFAQQGATSQTSIEHIAEELQRLQASVTETLSSAQTNSQSQTEQFAAQLQGLTNDAQALQERFAQQGTTTQTSIAQVAAELRQLQASVTAAISSVQNRQSQSEQALQQIQPLSSELGSLQERFAQQSITSQAGIDQVAEHLQQLQTSVTELTVQSESAFDRVASLADSHEQQTNLASITQRLNTNITQLQDELNSLKLDVDEFRSRLEARLPTPEPDFPHNIIPNLPTADSCDREIVLGIDFGTGFTKVCFWDVGTNQAEIVTFAAYTAEESTLEQALIPTKLAILSDDTLLTGLTVSEWENNTHVIKRSIDFIKMRLADLDMPPADSWRLDQLPELNEPDTVESICAYYLSQVITRAQAWIEENRPDLFENQTVHWSVNIGVPAAYCDSPALARFHRVLSLAWVLSYSPAHSIKLTLPKLLQLSAHIQEWMDANIKQDALNCITTPEITAAAWSFLSSQAAQDGFYTLFDIGDGTIDGSAFRFWRDGGTRRLDIYETEVKPLGVSALVKQAADELDSSFESVRQRLSSPNDLDFQQQIQDSKSKKRVQKLVASVVFDGNTKHHTLRCALAKDEIGTNLRVLVGGGGSNIPFFQNTIESTHRDFNHKSSNIPSYQLKEIPSPENLATNGLAPKEFGRFTVAYGLCMLAYEDPDFMRLPSQVDKDKAPIQAEYSQPTSYEDTQDMM